MLEEVHQKKQKYLGENQDVKDQIKNDVVKETSELLQRLFATTDKGIEIIERSDVERCDRESLKAVKAQYIKVKRRLL